MARSVDYLGSFGFGSFSVRDSGMEFNSQEYHYLADLKRQLTNPDVKRQLVHYEPVIAAEVFYDFGDNELGGFLVEEFSKSHDDRLRGLALMVKDVLLARDERNSNLTEVLGVKPLLVEQGEDYLQIEREGEVDNSERMLDVTYPFV